MKTCNVCKQQKPLDEFHRSSSSPDGRQYRCKPCAIAAARQRAKDNPEAAREADRRYRQTDKYKANRKQRREGPQRERILEQKRESWARHSEANSQRLREARQTDPERFTGYYRNRYTAHRENILERNREWADSNREKVRARRRLWAFGLTPEEFERKLQEQEGRCDICGIEMHLAADRNKDGSLKTNGICIDHDHGTGVVRGLLCSRCNKGLGHFKDDLARLRAAVDYLTKHQAPA